MVIWWFATQHKKVASCFYSLSVVAVMYDVIWNMCLYETLFDLALVNSHEVDYTETSLPP